MKKSFWLLGLLSSFAFADENTYMIEKFDRNGDKVVTQDEFYVNEIAEVKSDHIIHVPKTNQYYGSFSSQKPRCTLDSFTKFYKIVKSVKSDTYV